MALVGEAEVGGDGGAVVVGGFEEGAGVADAVSGEVFPVGFARGFLEEVGKPKDRKPSGYCGFL